MHPSPHPVSLRVRPAGGWEPPRASPLYLSPDILPCITALALLGCSYPRHTLLHHIPSSLHVGPDPQTSLPWWDRPPDLHRWPLRWTHSSPGSGACTLIHAVKQTAKFRKKDHQASKCLIEGAGEEEEEFLGAALLS